MSLLWRLKDEAFVAVLLQGQQSLVLAVRHHDVPSVGRAHAVRNLSRHRRTSLISSDDVIAHCAKFIFREVCKP